VIKKNEIVNVVVIPFLNIFSRTRKNYIYWKN